MMILETNLSVKHYFIHYYSQNKLLNEVKIACN